MAKFLPAWEEELQDDEDRDFLLHGLKNGFPLVDNNDTADISTVRSQNHNSIYQHRDKVELKLTEEIEDGNYIPVAESTVKIISPLAAVPKNDGDIRIIHDLSFPQNTSLNDHASKGECRYESINDAIKQLQPGMWASKVDLKSAYRSMKINQNIIP